MLERSTMPACLLFVALNTRLLFAALLVID
jgi:hypothetical protein